MKSKKNILKIIILIIAIALIIFVGYLIYKEIMISKMKSLLENSDSSNYQLIQTSNGETTTVKVYGKVMTSEDDESFIWVSETENLRVIMDKSSKLAMITENPEDSLKVASLNSSYIDNYFESSNMKFKYLGREDEYYKVQFTNEDTGFITILYINKETGIVKKMIEEFSESQNTYEFEVTLDCLSSEDVEYPDLTEYEIGVSSSSVVEAEESDEDITENNMETSENVLILTEE